jgi:hypothetical protein
MHMEHPFALCDSEFGQMVPEHGLGADRGHGAGQLRPRDRAEHEIPRLPMWWRRQAPARCYGQVFVRKLSENGVPIGVLCRPDEGQALRLHLLHRGVVDQRRGRRARAL